MHLKKGLASRRSLALPRLPLLNRSRRCTRTRVPSGRYAHALRVPASGHVPLAHTSLGHRHYAQPPHLARNARAARLRDAQKRRVLPITRRI